MDDTRRTEERTDTRASVRFDIGGVLRFGTVRNLSRGGCMIESSQIDSEVGTRCAVRLGPSRIVNGRVAWMLGQAMGVTFDLPIPDALVRRYALDDWPCRMRHAGSMRPN